MYYLRTKSAVDAIKFTLKKEEKKETVGAEVEAIVAEELSTKPMTPQELREMLAQSKNAADDDCLMCGS